MATIRPRVLDAQPCARLAGRRVTGLTVAGGELAWLDPGAGRLHLGRWESGRVRHFASLGVEGRPRSAVPARSGGWITTTGTDVLHVQRDGRNTTLARIPGVAQAACDPAGRLWLSTGDALLRVSLSGTVETAGGEPATAMAWSPDTSVVHLAGAHGVVTHDFDLANGTVDFPRLLVTESPAGLAVDDEGHVWVTAQDGVRRYSPTGDLEAVVRTVFDRPVGCCFAGDVLLVVTADGVLHSCRVDVSGRDATAFAGRFAVAA